MNVQLTQYGPSTKSGGWDPDGDSDTDAGWGAWGNKLTPASCALKASTAAVIGAAPRAKIEITLRNGRTLTRFFDDHIPETDPGTRCDLYMPNGYDPLLDDRADIRVVADDGSTAAAPLSDVIDTAG